MKIRQSCVGVCMWMVIFVATFLTPACAKEPGDPPTSLSSAVYPQSEGIEYHLISDVIWQVDYKVQENYPAEKVLQFIRTALERQNWLPLKEDLLNPDLSTSHVTGWNEYVDGRTTPKTQVRQWLAQWKNPRGDVVLFRLQYRHPKETSSIPKTVSVLGIYTPAHIVELQLKEVEANRHKIQKQEK